MISNLLAIIPNNKLQKNKIKVVYNTQKIQLIIMYQSMQLKIIDEIPINSF